jgi:hypothetical protein
MSDFFQVVSNNALISALVAAAVLGAAGWVWKGWHDRKDSQAIYSFMLGSRSRTGYTFRSTEAISSHTKISEKRVAALCARHPRIRRNEKEKQSWTVVE